MPLAGIISFAWYGVAAAYWWLNPVKTSIFIKVLVVVAQAALFVGVIIQLSCVGC